jgi:hypothetical protein
MVRRPLFGVVGNVGWILKSTSHLDFTHSASEVVNEETLKHAKTSLVAAVESVEHAHELYVNNDEVRLWAHAYVGWAAQQPTLTLSSSCVYFSPIIYARV